MSLTFDSARMHNPYITSEHEAWRTQVRRFIEAEIMPYAESWDEEGNIPSDLWVKAAGVGLLGFGSARPHFSIVCRVCIRLDVVGALAVAFTSARNLKPLPFVQGA